MTDEPWFGSLPPTWTSGNIRRFATMKTGHTPSRSIPEYWSETTIPWFTLADIWQLRDGTRRYLGETTSTISELGLANSAAELLPAGTVVFSRTASVGFSGIMPRPMATSQDFWNWVCGPDLLPEYLLQVFRAMQPWLRGLMMGSTHKTIYQHDAAAIKIPVPPLAEQRAIADYLDAETAKIDTLIVKQEQLVETLRERRTATVVEAIRGPGTVPLKLLVDADRPMTYGILQCGEPVPDGVPYVGPSDMPGGGTSPPRASLRRTSPKIAAAYSRSVLRGGDVVVSIGPAYGKVALLAEEITGANLTQDTVRVASNPIRVDSRYLVWVLCSRDAADYWDLQIMGATFRRLNLGTLADTPIPLPALDEQCRIAEYLDEQTAKINTLIAKTQRFIELSRERRSALITAAVTGQIDVRTARQVPA